MPFGNALRVLPDAPRGMRSHRIEVPKEDDAPLLVRDAHVLQHPLLEVLARAVGVGRAAHPARLRQGELFGRAVDGRGRGEDEFLDPVIAHRLEQYERTHEVVVVVFDGLGDALAHGLEPREVDDGVDGMFLKDAVEHRTVADIRLVEGKPFARQLLRAGERLAAGIGKVIDDDGLVAMPQQLHQRMRADESGTARQKNVHFSLPCRFCGPSFCRHYSKSFQKMQLFERRPLTAAPRSATLSP